MLKNTIKLSFSLFTIIFFVACGDEGSSSSNDEATMNQIIQKQYVIINYHYPEDVCNSSDLKEILESYGAEDIVTLSTTQSVTCETYGKSNDGIECLTEDFNYKGEPTCIVGLNSTYNYSFYYKEKKAENRLFLEKMQNTILSAF